MEHSLGPACRLRPTPDADTDKEDGIPSVKAQFFYTAVYPIDDPLSGTIPSGGADSKPSKGPLRPFSQDDNDMLQQAWLGLMSESHRTQHDAIRNGRELDPYAAKSDTERRDQIIQELASKHIRIHSDIQIQRSTTQAPEALPETLLTACCPQLAIDALAELDTAFCALVRKTNPLFDVDEVVKDVISVMSQPHELRSIPNKGRHRRTAGYVTTSDDGISGRPFVRVLSSEHVQPITTAKQQRSDEPDAVPNLEDEDKDVVVGLARLHKVSLQTLQMKPIYWSPVNDVAIVTRGTWFYKDTMLPVSPVVANQLEAGYQELRPWSETWRDELRCAIEVGASGEEKVSYRLWPMEGDGAYRNTPVPTEPVISAHPFCSAYCFQGEAATEGHTEPHPADDGASEHVQQRPYSSYNVIYKDRTNAFLIKPSLQPSAYYGRRPIQKIMKGTTVGIPVVRGFDRLSWERMHRGKKSPPKKSTSHGLSSSSTLELCPACEADKDRSKVTDLVLVAHGIGQKIAERVESYHFTHAVNGFRRLVDSEFQSPVVQEILHNSQSRLMVLPLNWRIGLSFEDGGALQTGMEANNSGAAQPFGLKDIEPNTIPAIRSMISDVMFDIPFYMSHHKGKMIAALVSEANRVYRLWCRNNPGFAENGRVHLVAHSLGSVMAVEVLSRQPTVAPLLDLSRPEPETKFFEFDTRNLFLMGSPTGFFLLLERGALTPRRGRVKPGVDASDATDENIGGEVGMFGCLAVDNIYNILAKEDPIAYLLNGAVDPTYAASLKTAYVPTVSASFLKSFGDAMRTVAKGMGANPSSSTTDDGRPSTVRLPSQLELEVHDFTREEIAEKKAFLLNDNGQIDWFLRSGGGPLEIQYLNMLSAHSCYWSNTDFIRMLCYEIGRRPGRMNTLPAMRAVKSSRRQIPIAS
ncbi:uncharacterized protein TRIVIDRAFT_43365 [Trichoderma virens Gv29-8]|uniref:DDHD domain-containing protein n=1 Tax=Hypocrea virens (strain Gv29-8 / FGSC 10586) TaxID=413071 RepID=G9N6N7_HYPVG|nr:uncharacterized protein TRIVIDRAFT_43365 [Trichoderma virens Gv29-8]EHK17795.1 hypothetical protein TRIVIDRAFT_43365 [Trichoderma virens Gv29-8]